MVHTNSVLRVVPAVAFQVHVGPAKQHGSLLTRWQQQNRRRLPHGDHYGINRAAAGLKSDTLKQALRLPLKDNLPNLHTLRNDSARRVSRHCTNVL